MATLARKQLASAGLVTVTIAIALTLTWLTIPYLTNVFGSVPDRLLFWIPVWLAAFPVAIGSGTAAGLMLVLANDDLDDMPRKGLLKIAPRVAAKMFLGSIFGTVAICAFLLWPDI